MKTGICKLCLQKKELCKESHIIPDFHYKFLYGKNKELVYVNNKKVERRYNGEYEGNILCEDCDGKIIGRLEDYASKLLHNKFSSETIFRIEQIDGKEHVILENAPNYNYSYFKLFLLSILWRASISTRPFFRSLKLNNEKEEDLRLMILNSDAGDPREYSCLILLPPLVQIPDGGRGFITRHMQTMSPEYIKKDDTEICKFVIEGVHYFFIISAPETWCINPSVERNRLTIGFTSIQDQENILREIISIFRK